MNLTAIGLVLAAGLAAPEAADDRQLWAAVVDLTTPTGAALVVVAERTLWRDEGSATPECFVDGRWQDPFTSDGDVSGAPCRERQRSLLDEPFWIDTFGLDDDILSSFVVRNRAALALPCPLPSAAPSELRPASLVTDQRDGPIVEVLLSAPGYAVDRRRALLWTALRTPDGIAASFYFLFHRVEGGWSVETFHLAQTRADTRDLITGQDPARAGKIEP